MNIALFSYRKQIDHLFIERDKVLFAGFEPSRFFRSVLGVDCRYKAISSIDSILRSNGGNSKCHVTKAANPDVRRHEAKL